MRVFIVLFFFSLFSCNQKQEKISKEKKTISNKIINDNERSYSNNKKYVIGQIYNDSIINFGGLRVNYGFGKYIFSKTNEDYLIDSTVLQSKNIKLEEILFRPEDYASDLIKISDFTYALIKSKGFFRWDY